MKTKYSKDQSINNIRFINELRETESTLVKEYNHQFEKEYINILFDRMVENIEFFEEEDRLIETSDISDWLERHPSEDIEGTFYLYYYDARKAIENIEPKERFELIDNLITEGLYSIEAYYEDIVKNQNYCNIVQTHVYHIFMGIEEQLTEICEKYCVI